MTVAPVRREPQMNADEHGFCGPDSGLASLCSDLLSRGNPRLTARRAIPRPRAGTPWLPREPFPEELCYKLVFNKKSDDGSAKANLVAEQGAKCWGILFSVDAKSLTELDEAEGAPGHYRQENISITVSNVTQTVMTYLAQPIKVMPAPGRPYDWAR